MLPSKMKSNRATVATIWWLRFTVKTPEPPGPLGTALGSPDWAGTSAVGSGPEFKALVFMLHNRPFTRAGLSMPKTNYFRRASQTPSKAPTPKATPMDW